MNPESEPGSQTEELLQRILRAVEPAKPKRNFEAAAALVLSLATMASAWCAYQSKLWGGAQAAKAGAGAAAAREIAVNSIAAVQSRAFDASMFVAYIGAQFESNRNLEVFLEKRFRPDFKLAMEAWLKTNPLGDPSAPLSPFQMREYAQKELAEVSRQQAIADQAMQASREARRYSDNYVLLTVLFASVLFFGGIARAFESPRLRTVLTLLSLVLFLCTAYAMSTMPVCHE